MRLRINPKRGSIIPDMGLNERLSLSLSLPIAAALFMATRQRVPGLLFGRAGRSAFAFIYDPLAHGTEGVDSNVDVPVGESPAYGELYGARTEVRTSVGPQGKLHLVFAGRLAQAAAG